MWRLRRKQFGIGIGLAALLVCGVTGRGVAVAQVLRPAGALVGDLGRTASGVLSEVNPSVGGLVSNAEQTLQSPAALLDARETRLRREAARYPRLIELDEKGQPAVRGHILALDLSVEDIARAQAAGFVVDSVLDLGGSQTLTALRAPSGMSARDGLRRLKSINPKANYDYDHLYEPSGSVGAGASGVSSSPHDARNVVIGMVDGGVELAHPAFAHAHIRPQGFSPGGYRPSAHGTAVASLLVGEAPGFNAAAAGAMLLAADVYGGRPDGGSVEAIAKALIWLQAEHARVVNISLVGPPNLVLQAVVARMIASGEVVVAPVGNDGPAAPLAYPAAYPQVVAVTPVDGRRRPLLEAGRAPKPAFSAAGADMVAAALGGGFAQVRGSSFAAPLVAARIAVAVAETGDARLALQRVQGEALHAPGESGLGLVGWADRPSAAARR